MKAGIVIDKWKLPIFERHLTQAGFTYKAGAGLTADTLLITVTTDNAPALETIVRTANAEAAKQGKGGA